MADAVSTQILHDDQSRAVMKFVNTSDGTGETQVVKVAVGDLAHNSRGEACTEVVIEKIIFGTYGMYVTLYWQTTGADDEPIIHLGESLSDTMDFTGDNLRWGGLWNDANPATKTGNITLTTTNHTNGDFYDLILYLRKKY